MPKDNSGDPFPLEQAAYYQRLSQQDHPELVEIAAITLLKDLGHYELDAARPVIPLNRKKLGFDVTATVGLIAVSYVTRDPFYGIVSMIWITNIYDDVAPHRASAKEAELARARVEKLRGLLGVLTQNIEEA